MAKDYSKHYILNKMVAKPEEPQELLQARSIPTVNEPSTWASSLAPTSDTPVGFASNDAFLTAMKLLSELAQRLEAVEAALIAAKLCQRIENE